jgi:hypothetical protein
VAVRCFYNFLPLFLQVDNVGIAVLDDVVKFRCAEKGGESGKEKREKLLDKMFK